MTPIAPFAGPATAWMTELANSLRAEAGVEQIFDMRQCELRLPEPERRDDNPLPR